MHRNIMQVSYNISVIEVAYATRRTSSTLLRLHGSGVAQQNRQKMPKLRPAFFPYRLTTTTALKPASLKDGSKICLPPEQKHISELPGQIYCIPYSNPKLFADALSAFISINESLTLEWPLILMKSTPEENAIQCRNDSTLHFYL